MDEEKPAMTPIVSKKIAEVGYVAATKTLLIRFKAKKSPGSLYHYTGVEPAIYEGLIGAVSAGRYFSEVVQGKFGFTKIVEQPEEK